MNSPDIEERDFSICQFNRINQYFERATKSILELKKIFYQHYTKHKNDEMEILTLQFDGITITEKDLQSYNQALFIQMKKHLRYPEYTEPDNDNYYLERINLEVITSILNKLKLIKRKNRIFNRMNNLKRKKNLSKEDKEWIKNYNYKNIKDYEEIKWYYAKISSISKKQ